jgi:hypothetical protein
MTGLAVARATISVGLTARPQPSFPQSNQFHKTHASSREAGLVDPCFDDKSNHSALPQVLQISPAPGTHCPVHQGHTK